MKRKNRKQEIIWGLICLVLVVGLLYFGGFLHEMRLAFSYMTSPSYEMTPESVNSYLEDYFSDSEVYILNESKRCDDREERENFAAGFESMHFEVVPVQDFPSGEGVNTYQFVNDYGWLTVACTIDGVHLKLDRSVFRHRVHLFGEQDAADEESILSFYALGDKRTAFAAAYEELYRSGVKPDEDEMMRFE